MPTTIKTIAEHFGVSLSTASRALNDSGYVKQELREAIKAYSRENKWYASSAAVSMATGKTKTVAFVINKLSDYMNSVLLEQLVVNLRDKGFHVFVSQCYSPEEQEEGLESYLYRRPDAVVVFPLVLSQKVDNILDQLFATGTRVIAMGARQSEHCAAVSFDFHSQGFKFMEHLLENGHRKIAFWGEFAGKSPEKLLTTDEGNMILSVKRLKGSIEACKKAGINFDLKTDVIDYHNDETALRQALKAKKHTAFICSATTLLCIFYRICAELNIKIGDDISVIGLGDNPILEGFNPRPVCLAPNATQLGKTVAQLITNESSDHKKILVTPKLVLGDSIKNVKSSK